MRQEKVSKYVKYITRSEDTLFCDNHFCKVKKPFKTVDCNGLQTNHGGIHPRGSANVAILHHYAVKTKAEFLLKRARGRARIVGKRPMDYFTKFNHNEVHDDSAWKFFTDHSNQIKSENINSESENINPERKSESENTDEAKSQE
jgi:hypothetical protein